MNHMTGEEGGALLIKEGVAQVLRPFQDLLSKLLGPAATEVGLAWGDSLRAWRAQRQIRLLDELERMTEGKDIKPVAPRLFFPILEAASIEADDDMQSRWAALLANETTNTNSVHPSFIEILKQMAPEDARLLDKLYDWCESHNTSTVEWWRSKPSLDEREKETIGTLLRLGFLEAQYELIPGDEHISVLAGQPQVFTGTPKLKDDYTFTNIAFRFVEACRAPKEKSKSTPAA